jgi:hypothetical protein
MKRLNGGSDSPVSTAEAEAESGAYHMSLTPLSAGKAFGRLRLVAAVSFSSHLECRVPAGSNYGSLAT